MNPKFDVKDEVATPHGLSIEKREPLIGSILRGFKTDKH